MRKFTDGLQRFLAAAFIVGATTIAGCSGGGFLPFGEGPHSIAAARLNSIVAAQSRARHVPAALVHAVIAQESGGDPSAISPAGAMGLMQVMPGTATAYGVGGPFGPTQKMQGGVALLADLLRQYHGNVQLALAAYTAGSGAVSKYRGVPPYNETRAYVRDITQQYNTAAKP